MYHYHRGQFQSHVFLSWVLLPLSWPYMVGKTPSWGDKSVKNHSDFNIWYLFFSKHQMWQFGWFFKTRSDIMFFKTVIYTTNEPKNNPIWTLKAISYAFLSIPWENILTTVEFCLSLYSLTKVALQWRSLRHVCVHYCTITLLTVIRQGIIV